MMIRTNTCRYMPSSQYMQKHVYTHSAVYTGQDIKILSQLSINAERCQKDARLETRATHACTISALDVFKCMQPSMCADTC